MNHKKFIITITSLTLILVCFIFLSTNKIKETSQVNIDNTPVDLSPPKIYKINPSKCQQYIVSNPLIEVEYSDDSGVDLSSVKMFVNYKNVTKDCIITSDKVSYAPNNKFRRGNQIVKVILADASDNKNSQEFEWYFTVGTPIYTHYRGLLHAHTSASDGHGTYDDAYYMARDKAKLDFFAITEHSNMLDHFKECNLDDSKYSKEWTEIIKSRDKFYKNNEFLALRGFEMTYNHLDPHPIGHINIFDSDGFVSIDDNYKDLKDFYKLLGENDYLIGQFNHPCEKFGIFNNFEYDAKADKVISLLEVGNGYNKDMSKNIKAYDMYQLALDKGWHVAPTCNQDNHRVDFGICNEFRTVVLATDLTKDNLYDSLKKMRVYATEDKNLKIDYTINDLPMGTTISNPAKLRFSISVIDNNDSDKIQIIQVISNEGKIIKSKNFNSNLAKLEFTIKPEDQKFYYVKVLQDKNKTSVTAPIWIKNK